MAATIKDIAREVGVSPSTVSRVVNGNTVISDETREKIEQAMKRLDYHPNSRARSLVNGVNYTIALVIDADDENTFANAFFNRSVFAIEQVTQKQGYNLLITNDMDNAGLSISNLVYEKKVDGLILPSSSVTGKLLAILKEKNFPYVVLGEPQPGLDALPWVDINNYEGSRTAVKHLHEKGYRNIALILDNSETVFSKRRMQGYQDELHASDAQEPLVILSDGTIEGLRLRVADAVSNKNVDACLCTNNILSYQVMKIIRDIGMRIPEDIGIVTFDNYPFAEYMDPPLSAVDVDTYLLGEKAADLLFGKISENGMKRENVLINTCLYQRRSSAGKGGIG